MDISSKDTGLLMACTGLVTSRPRAGLKSLGTTPALVMVPAEQRLPRCEGGLSSVAGVPARGENCQEDPAGTCKATDFTGKYSSKEEGAPPTPTDSRNAILGNLFTGKLPQDS